MKNLLIGKTNILLVIVIIVGATGTLRAQKDSAETIEQIRRIYNQTTDRIAAAEKNFPESDVFFSELIVNKGGTMYPAVGIFRSVYEFYYTYGDREKDPYPNRLLKVSVSTKRSAMREYSEYLYDEAGNLIFYFEKLSDEPEVRIYFVGNRIVRFQRGDKIVGKNGREEISAAKAVQTQAAGIVEIFRNSIS